MEHERGPYDELFVPGVNGKARHLYVTERILVASYMNEHGHDWIVTKRDLARLIGRNQKSVDSAVRRLRRAQLLATRTVCDPRNNATVAGAYRLTHTGVVAVLSLTERLCDAQGRPRALAKEDVRTLEQRC